MKPSQYNTFFEYEGSTIGFNAYSGEFIVIDPILLDLYNVGVIKKDFSELSSLHKDFHDFLVRQGFLVELNVNEFERIRELSEKVDNDDSHFSLTVNPTMNCNFKCWYCYETHIKDSKMDESTISSTVNFAKQVIYNQPNLKSFTLSFFGGEPLLYFEKVIKPILAGVSSACNQKQIQFNCGMTTNGLLINQNILNYCKQYGLKHFQITLDGNRERHDKVRFISEGKGSYDRIVENIKLIIQNQLFANVRINCSAETMAELNSIMDDFSLLRQNDRQFIHFDIHKVWQVVDKIENDINISREFFRDSGFGVTSGSHDNVRNSCYADKRNHATINYNGEVFKCTARDFKAGSGEGILEESGIISWNEKHEKRLQSKFKNPPCMECKIFPICAGGCTQQAIEHEGVDYCVYGFDEELKKEQIINRFLATIS